MKELLGGGDLEGPLEPPLDPPLGIDIVSCGLGKKLYYKKFIYDLNL